MGLNFIFKNSGDAKTGVESCPMTLILKRPDIEIMHQLITPDALVWIAPADDRTTIEYFYVLSGSVSFEQEAGKLVKLCAGDSFYVESLTQDVAMTARERTELLYVTNRPVFEGIQDFHKNLFQLLKQINEKDNITMQHSRNVRLYTYVLYEELKPSEVKLDDLMNASVFHDVGKCEVPDEILKKQGKLTKAEYEVMKKHALASYEILLPIYGESVARLARCHHERLDGTGYPDKLRIIPYGSRLIAVADAFDAMTSPRTYNKIKTDIQACDELASLPEQFDADIVAKLRRLINENRLRQDAQTNAFEAMYE